MQGELQTYAPQGGYGLTPAGRKPTVAATPKITAGPAPDLEAGQDFAKAMRAFLPQSR